VGASGGRGQREVPGRRAASGSARAAGRRSPMHDCHRSRHQRLRPSRQARRPRRLIPAIPMPIGPLVIAESARRCPALPGSITVTGARHGAVPPQDHIGRPGSPARLTRRAASAPDTKCRDYTPSGSCHDDSGQPERHDPDQAATARRRDRRALAAVLAAEAITRSAPAYAGTDGEAVLRQSNAEEAATGSGSSQSGSSPSPYGVHGSPTASSTARCGVRMQGRHWG
jgi:hypothetical protein